MNLRDMLTICLAYNLAWNLKRVTEVLQNEWNPKKM
jgi:hypothetical protein